VAMATQRGKSYRLPWTVLTHFYQEFYEQIISCKFTKIPLNSYLL
jgi:hypothetical protein